jgi:hypothetical protein
MEEKKEVSQMLGKTVGITLADGKDYKLGQMGILDLVYFEEKFGTINVLFTNDKPFSVLVHILFCLLKQNHPNIKFEDLNNLLSFQFINKHPEIIKIIQEQLVGALEEKTNPPQPVETKNA